MPKTETKHNLLKIGSELIYKNGYNNTGIQEILNEADVPKGSFYFYFQSKEDFGLQVLDLYQEFLFDRMNQRFEDYSLSPLDRIKKFFDDFMDYFSKNHCTGGCPVGNLAQEMGDINSAFREKMSEIFEKMKENIKYCLKEAQVKNHISGTINTNDYAEFIINSWEGALIKMKLSKSTDALSIFDGIVFKDLLK